MTSTILAAAAFGAEPGRWPLPAARDPEELLLRAVAAGGQGRYGSAYADLAELLRREPRGRWSSLAMSTRASFHRQLGWHALARGWDGRALAIAGADPQARHDALIGLAADALGLGRLAAAAALLERAPACSDGVGVLLARQQIRLAWVRAELAMAAGDGAGALTHARHGVELAELAWTPAPPGQERRRACGGAVQCRRTGAVTGGGRRRAARHPNPPLGAAAVGAGLPAGRHRKCRAQSGRGDRDP